MQLFWLLFEGAITSALVLWIVKHPQAVDAFGTVTTGGVLDSVHALQGQ